MNASLRDWARQLRGEVSGDQVSCPGPGHSAKDRSLSVKPDAQAPGGFIVNSHSGDDFAECRDYVRERLGMPKWEPGRDSAARSEGPGRIVSTYDYVDRDGVLVKQAVRYDPKAFRQRRPDPAQPSGWAWKGLKDVPNAPYRLAELRASTHEDPVFIVEGEKDADCLGALGIIATTNIGGAGNWTPDLNIHFAWRTVFILADNDEAGAAHAAKVAASIHEVAEAVTIVNLPGLPPKGDVSDWLAAGNDPFDLLEISETFPRFDPNSEPSDDGLGGAIAESG